MKDSANPATRHDRRASRPPISGVPPQIGFVIFSNISKQTAYWLCSDRK
jgi:hypothetical protein